jgi:hypothetical protein
MTTMAQPPPPPPSKRSRKPLIVVIVILLIAILAVGIYLGTRGTGTSPSATSTPNPSSSATPAPTTSPTSSGCGSNVAGASSLQYTVSITNSSGAVQGSWTYYAKNAGTNNLMLRIDYTDSTGENFVYIVNGVQQKVWYETGGQWTDLSADFTSQQTAWSGTFTGYRDNLANWSGTGDRTYTDPYGDTVRIYNISVNPSLADSLFQHS